MNLKNLKNKAHENIELLITNIETASLDENISQTIFNVFNDAKEKLRQIADSITEANVVSETKPQIIQFCINDKPYHIQILPWGEWRLVLVTRGKNHILASSDHTQTTKAGGRFVKQHVLSPKARTVHKKLEGITHPCLTKDILLPSNIINCTEVCIEESFNIEWENMLTLEKQKKPLTSEQFLLMAFLLVSFLKTLHQQDMILGAIDADTIKLQPMGDYYLPLLKKYNMPYLRSVNNENKKGDDTRQLCRMLLVMDHDNNEAIDNLLIEHAKNGTNDNTDALFNRLNAMVSEKVKNNFTDLNLVEVSCHGGVVLPENANIDAIIRALNTYARNHQIDLLHQIAQQNYFEVNKKTLCQRRDEIISGLNQAERTSLFYAIPEFAEESLQADLKAVAVVPHEKLPISLPSPSSKNNVAYFDPWNYFWQSLYGCVLYFSNYAEVNVAIDNSVDVVADDDTYIDTLRHLLRHCREKKELFKHFFEKIPHKKLSIVLNDLYARNDTDELHALKSVYANISFEATEFLYDKNLKSAVDIAFTHRNLNSCDARFTSFINDKILLNDEFARHALKVHGISVTSGEPISTETARFIIDKKKPKNTALNHVWTGLDKVIEMIQQYEDQVLKLRRQEECSPYFLFSCRKHSIIERQDMCRELLQACSEAKNINEICKTLDVWIAKLKGYSFFGNSRLAENLEKAKGQINQIHGSQQIRFNK
jgi:hypothetical protein